MEHDNNTHWVIMCIRTVTNATELSVYQSSPIHLTHNHDKIRMFLTKCRKLNSNDSRNYDSKNYSYAFSSNTEHNKTDYIEPTGKLIKTE